MRDPNPELQDPIRLLRFTAGLAAIMVSGAICICLAFMKLVGLL